MKSFSVSFGTSEKAESRFSLGITSQKCSYLSSACCCYESGACLQEKRSSPVGVAAQGCRQSSMVGCSSPPTACQHSQVTWQRGRAWWLWLQCSSQLRQPSGCSCMHIFLTRGASALLRVCTAQHGSLAVPR